MRALRSCQTNHIKHAGTMFQMIERCFPNQFLQIKKKDFTDLGITHWISNTAKTSHHKAWENLQWRRRWSTDSPLQRHKQHLLTKNWPFSIRLSMVSIPSLAIVHNLLKLHEFRHNLLNSNEIHLIHPKNNTL